MQFVRIDSVEIVSEMFPEKLSQLIFEGLS